MKIENIVLFQYILILFHLIYLFSFSSENTYSRTQENMIYTHKKMSLQM
jgi:hypothetical protein